MEPPSPKLAKPTSSGEPTLSVISSLSEELTESPDTEEEEEADDSSAFVDFDESSSPPLTSCSARYMDSEQCRIQVRAIREKFVNYDKDPSVLASKPYDKLLQCIVMLTETIEMLQFVLDTREMSKEDRVKLQEVLSETAATKSLYEDVLMQADAEFAETLNTDIKSAPTYRNKHLQYAKKVYDRSEEWMTYWDPQQNTRRHSKSANSSSELVGGAFNINNNNNNNTKSGKEESEANVSGLAVFTSGNVAPSDIVGIYDRTKQSEQPISQGKNEKDLFSYRLDSPTTYLDKSNTTATFDRPEDSGLPLGIHDKSARAKRKENRLKEYNNTQWKLELVSAGLIGEHVDTRALEALQRLETTVNRQLAAVECNVHQPSKFSLLAYKWRKWTFYPDGINLKEIQARSLGKDTLDGLHAVFAEQGYITCYEVYLKGQLLVKIEWEDAVSKSCVVVNQLFAT